MKNKMQPTSLEAYQSIQPELNYMQKQVLDAIRILAPISNRSLLSYMKLEINSISGRVNELAKDGKIYEYDKRRDNVTGRTAIRWAVVPISKQLKLL